MTRERISGARPVNTPAGSEVFHEMAEKPDAEALRDEYERDQWLRDNVPPHHG